MTSQRRLVVQVLLLALLAAGAVMFFLVHYDMSSSRPAATLGSGTPASETRSVDSFTRVELAGSNNVTIKVGEPQSVIVHADDNLMRKVTTAVHEGTLVVGNSNGSFTPRSPMWVAITTPAIDGLTLSGSGNIDVSGVATPNLSVNLPGSGNIRASGRADELDVSIPGSGTAQLRALTARDVQTTVDGSGEITITATSSLSAVISGSGAVIYGGNPGHVQTSITGSGAVTPLP
jgi:hypothetical protein